MQQWEYHREVIPLGQEIEICEAAGQDGWECCGMVMAALAPKNRVALASREPPAAQPGLLLLFKRPLGGINGQLAGAPQEFVFAR